VNLSRWSIPFALAAAACLPKVEVSERLGLGGSGGDAGLPACGAEGQPCCDAPTDACGTRLFCDTTRTCVQDEERLCTTVEQCRVGQTCCPAGMLGKCVTVEPGAACPQPDLAVTTTQSAFTASLAREERLFDPQSSAHDACALEKGCIGASGLRRLLRFTAQVANTGDADLIIGAPGAASGFKVAACDGQLYLEDYLRYELVTLVGNVVARGHMQARCQALPPGFSSRFSCDFWGLWSGFTQTFDAYTYTADNPQAVDCQWIDITGVAPGDYLVRMHVDPSGVLEPGGADNNSAEFALTIPVLDEPLQACVAPDSENPLLGYGAARECGWGLGPQASCVPDSTVRLSCPDCTGDPMLRACDGSAPCSFDTTLASGDSTLSDCDTGELLGDECYGRGAACCFVSECPLLVFTCPASGTYTLLSSYYSSPGACSVVDEGGASSSGNAGP
jgi:lysyl oxidase